MTLLPEILTTDHVMERYGLRDPRAARDVMRRAGGYVIGGRMIVRADDLDAWEREQAEAARTAAKAAQRAQDGPGRGVRAIPRGVTNATPGGAPERYPRDWWRNVPEDGRA